MLKQVPVLLEDHDKNVREEGKRLVVELYLDWTGSKTSNVCPQTNPGILYLLVILNRFRIFFYRLLNWKQNLKS